MTVDSQADEICQSFIELLNDDSIRVTVKTESTGFLITLTHLPSSGITVEFIYVNFKPNQELVDTVKKSLLEKIKLVADNPLNINLNILTNKKFLVFNCYSKGTRAYNLILKTPDEKFVLEKFMPTFLLESVVDRIVKSMVKEFKEDFDDIPSYYLKLL